jgi:hypothetical protein
MTSREPLSFTAKFSPFHSVARGADFTLLENGTVYRANRRQHEHLYVYASVIGVDALYAVCKAKALDRTSKK